MTDLERLAARCKGEVSVVFHPHTVSYQTIQEYLSDGHGDFKRVPPAGSDAWTSLVEIQFYPNTPIGSYLVVAETIGEAVRQAHEILDGEKR